MSRTYVPYIAALGLLWGASYMFIKVAVRGYEPAAMIMLPSAVAKAWNGVIDGCRAPIGPGTAPPVV